MEGLPCLDKVETAAFYRKALSRKMAKHFHRPERRFEAFLGHFDFQRILVAGECDDDRGGNDCNGDDVNSDDDDDGSDEEGAGVFCSTVRVMSPRS